MLGKDQKVLYLQEGSLETDGYTVSSEKSELSRKSDGSCVLGTSDYWHTYDEKIYP